MPAAGDLPCNLKMYSDQDLNQCLWDDAQSTEDTGQGAPMNSFYFSETSPSCLYPELQIGSSVCHLGFDFVCLDFCSIFATNYLFFKLLLEFVMVRKAFTTPELLRDLPMFFFFITSCVLNFYITSLMI